ncbi:MAG: hypothetical protein R2752_00310 [Vicinamibacterales bacterium]
MPQLSSRLRVRLTMLAGLLLVGYPLGTELAARQGQGGGQAEMRMINTDNLDPRLQGFRWRAIGPVGQGARIDDIEDVESNPSIYYIGHAVSGLWKTTNNGTTYEPLFDEIAHSIGDIAIAQSSPDTVYVGTGEANNRQSSSFGIGMFKTTDGGKTWAKIGLEDTQSIARIRVHPRNPDIVWVAAMGHLFGPNEQRGVFMSTDGGTTWQKTLYVNQDTGANDIVVDPGNPNHLFASTYERRRQSWGFVGGGLGSGIHESTDGGKTWKKVTGNGLPRGTMGRIAFDWSRSNPNIIWAQIEVAPDKEPPAPPSEQPEAQAGRGGRGGGGGGGGGRGGGNQPPDPASSGIWRSNDRGKTWTFVSNENQRPMYFSQIRVDPNNPEVLYTGGVGPRKSTDGGKTWMGLNNMGHVDNHAIWIDPSNSNHVMYGNDGGLDVSWDAGQTWESPRLTAAALSYHVSVGMDRPYTVCTGLQDNGSWCGPSSVRSNQGIRMWHWISVGGGDGFQTQIDPTDPNIFYTESQNGGINRYDLTTGQTASARPNTGRGGRGGGGGGGGGRGGQGNIIASASADELAGDEGANFNWNTPIRISHFNPSTILIGGNRLFISRDRGETFVLTQEVGKGIDPGDRTLLETPYNRPNCGRGAGPGVPCILSKHDGLQANEYGTIIEIAESPIRPGYIWVGTNDGNVQLTRDEGRTFTNVGTNIPGGNREYQVSGIEASWYDPGTAYVALDGHNSDDLKPYIYKTTDYGKTWKPVMGNLPLGNVNTIRQDPVNQNLLYAATEFGFYVSFDDGGAWHRFMPNLPVGRVDEVLVHPREHDLVLASHGRGIWIMDDITALEAMGPETLQAPATLFQPRDSVLWKTDRRLSTEIPGDKYWEGENAPRGTAINYYLGRAANEAKITITNTATGDAVRTCLGSTNAGMNRYQWTLTPNPGQGGGGGRGFGGGGRGGQQAQQTPAPTGPQPCDAGGGGGRGGFGRGGFGGGGIGPGVYRVTLSIDGRDVDSKNFSILEDVWMK